MNNEEILEWLAKYNINNSECKYTINKDMSIDVVGDVGFYKIPSDRIPTSRMIKVTESGQVIYKTDKWVCYKFPDPGQETLI